MTAVALDDFLLRYAPGPRVPLSPALPSARAALARATETLRAIPDAALPGPWSKWGPDGEVRYGFYRILESLETAELAASAAVRRATERVGVARSASGDLTSLTTAARWDLHGRLAVIDDGILDTDPGGGEWNLRQTMAHVVSGQRGYGWYTAYWLAQGAADANDLPLRVPDEELEGRGSLAEIRDRFDSTVDGSTEVLGRLDEQALALGSRWMGNPVTIGFRIGRWSSHIREHTVQVDKTLAMIGWMPREVDRLIGLIHAAYGRLEAAVYAVPTDVLESTEEDGRTPAVIVEDALASAEEVAAEVADIALAGVAGAAS